MYKLTKYDAILRISDNTHIPKVTGNRDYREYLDWVAAGNTAQPADAPSLFEQNMPILMEIEKEEKKQLRCLREHVLGDNTAIARIQSIDDAIRALRAKLVK